VLSCFSLRKPALNLANVAPKLALLLLVASLVACRSQPVPSTGQAPVPNNGRYALENDIPANEPIDLAAIREVIPKVEKRTCCKNPYAIPGRGTYRVLATEAGYSEVGIASWYGRKFHGHLTANGEQYDMFQVSAAHTVLPLPSYVRVTNLDNGRSLVARVNDRGPFHPGRIIDMSYAGAVLLGYAKTGTARVKVEAIVPDGAQPAQAANTVIVAPIERPNRRALPPSAPGTPAQPRAATTVAVAPEDIAPAVEPPAEQSVEALASERALIDSDKGSDFLQVGAFATQASAQNLQKRVQQMTDMQVVIHQEAGSDGRSLFKVRVGPLGSEAQVQALQSAVQTAGLGSPYKVRY
jgi:rare lipoprotein A